MDNLLHANPNLASSQIYSEAYFIWLNWIYFNIVYGLVVFLVSSATHPYTASDCFLSSFLRSSLPGVFCKKVVVKNFAELTGKQLRQSLFFNKVTAAASNFIKKETLAQVFFSAFCKFLRTPFFKKHLWWLLLLF